MHTQAVQRYFPPPKRCPDKHKNKFVCTYDFCNELGTVVFQKTRYAYLDPEAAGRPKTFRYWKPTENGRGWEWGKPAGADGLVYRLPELLAAVRGGAPVIYVVEGEKDADNAVARGQVATTNHQAGGPGNKVTDEQGRWFQGYSGRVRIVADNDVTGYATAARWRTVLLAAGLTERQLQVVRARFGKDLSDHLAAGRSPAGLRRVPLTELEAKAAQYSEAVGTWEGYGSYIKVEKAAKRYEEAGYSQDMARILAYQRAGRK